MKSKRFTASIQLPPRGKAPERIRIWRAGENPGNFGQCLFTPKAAADVMAAFVTRGNAGAIDIEHATNRSANPDYDPSKPPPGGGYYSLELADTPDGPELWCSVRWSDYAIEQIESGSRCYVSPDWQMDSVTREPLMLNKLSLVQEPGTYSISMLASRAGASDRSFKMDSDLLKALIADAQKLADSAESADLKAMGADLAKQLTDAATKLGVDLTAAPEAPAAQAAADAPPPAPPAKEEEKAVAKIASKGITIADVTAAIREENAKRDLLVAAKNRVGMTAELANVLASKSLSEVRAIVGALPMAAGSDIKVKLPALNATASAPAPEAEEKDDDILKLRRQLGVSAENAVAAKADAVSGQLGVLSVARLQEMKAKARKEAAAKSAQ